MLDENVTDSPAQICEEPLIDISGITVGVILMDMAVLVAVEGLAQDALEVI